MRSHVPLGSLSHYGKSSVNYPQCGEKGRALRTNTHALARPAEARLAPSRCGDGAHARAIVPILPAERTICRTRLPLEVERCRGVLRRALRQQVDYRVTDRTADKLLS